MPDDDDDRPKAHWALRVLGWVTALGCLGVIAAAATFFIGYKLTDIPDPNTDFQMNTTLVYYSDGQTPLGKFSEQNRLSVPLSSIPKYVRDAHIAAEDRTFWTNPGIEPSGMARAVWNISRGQELQGGSTITQQYVKLMYLNQERTVTRKFKELFIAIKLSRSDDKSRILEDYLNTIYYGRGAYGVRAAELAFFGTDDVSKLTVGQSAFLASILNNPTLFNADNPANHQRILERYRYVLDGMRQMGTITAAQEAKLRVKYPDPIKPKASNKYAGPNGFLLAMTRKYLVKAGFSDEDIDGGGLRVTTTFNKDLQDTAVKAVGDEHPEKTDKLHIALASVDPKTGDLVAMYGGPDYLKSQLNWADRRARPGSSFKPFAVAAALKEGVSLKDTFQGDSPILVDHQKFRNELNEDYGDVTLLKATELSVNTAFYDLVDNRIPDGPSKLVDMAIAAGLSKNVLESERQKPATVLGPDAYASPVEMASAYGTFANSGRHADLRVIKQVKDVHGKILKADKPVVNQVIDEGVANDTTYALQKVVEKGTGRSWASKIDRPAGGKTGTAGGTSIEHFKHNNWIEHHAAYCKEHRREERCQPEKEGADTLTSWWVGFTPQLSTAVLYRAGDSGESDLDPYSSNPAFFGGNWPARTWLEYMQNALANQPKDDFGGPSAQNSEFTPTFTPTPTVETQTPTPTLTPSLPPTKPGRPKTTPPPTTTTTTPHKPPKTTIPLPTSTTTATPAPSP